MIFKWLSSLRIRTKIQVTLLFMVLMLALFGGLSGYYIDSLTRGSVEDMSRASTVTRYNSEIIINLNEIMYTLSFSGGAESFRRINLRKNFDRIDSYLNLQEMRSEDPKLLELIANMREDVGVLRQTIASYSGGDPIPLEAFMQISYISNLLREVQKVNEQATQKRIEDSVAQANRTMLFLVIFGMIFFAFAVFTMLYFPDYLANPIRRLTDSIREITRKNYAERLDVRSRDEFGQMAASFNLMAEKLNEYESMNVAKIVAEKQRIETIIGEMGEAIIGLDAQQTILFINATAQRLLAMPEEMLVGRTLQEVASGNKVMEDLEKEILRGKVDENRTYPNLTVHQNGRTYYFEKDILRVNNPEGEAAALDGGMVVILKNITEFREKDLNKTNLLATLSHELKTPISAIDMSLGLLEDSRIGSLNEEQKDLAGTIRQNASRLLNMVNEILDLSRIESGNIQLDLSSSKPEDLVKRALNSTLRQYEKNGVRLHAKVEEGLPEMEVDIQKTTSVLINFLTNALRYSAEGDEVRIEVRKIPGKVVFTVTDQGPGIPEADQEKIFQRYSRATNDKTQGTGLGLAISKEFIEKQGGRIWVKSEDGEGSTFGFHLKL